jgi:hypothetical protein
VFDNSIPYELLREMIEEEKKCGKIEKYWQNTMTVELINKNQILVFYPNE